MKNEYKALLESANYESLDENQMNTLAAVMASTASETERMIAEGSIASDVAQFTPFLMPMLRKVYPALIANELLGIQPLSGPTGFIYSLTNRLVGSAAGGLTKPGVNEGGTGPASFNQTNGSTQILLVDTDAGPVVGEGVTLSTGLLTGAAFVQGADEAEIVYVEPTQHGALGSNYPTGQVVGNSVGGAVVGAQAGNSTGVLVQLPTNMVFGVSGVQTVYQIAGSNVQATFSGLAAWDKILPNYSGSYTTANGETRGTVGNEMNEVGISVERTQVEAKTKSRIHN